MSDFSEDDIKRTGIPADVMGLLHDLCYHVNNNLRGTMDEVAVNNYVRKAQEILKERTMSLQEKWSEFCNQNSGRPVSFKEVFFAGAQAGIDTIPIPPEEDAHEVQKEIDAFNKSLKVLPQDLS